MAPSRKTPFPATAQLGPRFPVDVPGGAPGTFGFEGNRVDVRTFDLSTARNGKREQFGASNFIWVIDASDFNSRMDVQFNSQGHSKVPFKLGQVVKGLNFDTLYLTNTAQAGKSITFFIVREQEGNIEVANPSVNFTGISLSGSKTLTSLADVDVVTATDTTLIAANTDRVRAHIMNLDISATIRVGGTGTTLGFGMLLAAGDALVIETEGVIMARHDTGSNVTMALMEELKV